MRLRSLGWALLASLAAGLGAATLGWGPAWPAADPVLRASGCGFFYGLLAFHLQRVDPDDGHLQAGLVGAVCALRSLAAPLDPQPLAALIQAPPAPDALAARLLSAMMALIGGWLPLWLPLIGSALLLHGVQRWLPSRP